MGVPRGIVKRGPSGVALVKLLKKKVKVEFDEDDDGGGGGTYLIPRKNVPSHLRKGGRMIVSLSADTTSIRSIKPVKDSHVVGFLGFTRPKNTPMTGPAIPIKKERSWRDKETGVIKKKDYMGFTAVMEILEGDFRGCRIWGPLEYRFIEVNVGGEALTGIYGKSARDYIRLTTFLESAGLDWDEDVLEYSENVLPDVEELLAEVRVVPFLCYLDGKGGWPDKYAVLPSHLAKEAKKTLRKARKKYQKWIEESVD